VGLCVVIHGALYLWDGIFLFSSRGGMVDRSAVQPWFPSLLDLWPNGVFANVILLIYFLGGLLMWQKRQLALVVPMVWLMHINLHHFNPYIVHEPQQILSVFLLFLVLSHSFRFDPKVIVLSLRFWLVVYYLLAGGKKLLDPSWRAGTAMGEILGQPMLTQTFIGGVQLSSWLSMLLTYSALLFELGFPLVFWRSLRRWVLAFGVLFHWLSLCFLAIGTFPLVMSAWYLLFLQESDYSAFTLRLRKLFRFEFLHR
jgi:hypothetical protein